MAKRNLRFAVCGLLFNDTDQFVIILILITAVSVKVDLIYFYL